MGRTRVWIGGLASILYVLVMVVMAVLRWDELRQLDLNALGDFLAGAFGPLAILWLVLGYFQQGDELRQNTEALRLQAAELRSSVLQQEQLVLATREQIAAERLMALDQKYPRFELTSSRYADDDESATVSLFIKNLGREAYSVHLTTIFPSATHTYDLGMSVQHYQHHCQIEHLEDPPSQCNVSLVFRVDVPDARFPYLLTYQAEYREDSDGLLCLHISPDAPTIKASEE